MKDAQDLVHALQDNLGWTELALREESGNLKDLVAVRLLRTCQHLTQLLAGAVEIARRDACAVTPELRETLLTDLALDIRHHLRKRFRTVDTDLSATNCFGATIFHDRQVTQNVLDRILENQVGTATDTASCKVQVGLCGVNAAITIQCEQWNAYPQPAFDEKLAICSALLARQGAALDVEVHELGGCDMIIIWPARTFTRGANPTSEPAGTRVATSDHVVSSLAGALDETEKERSGTMSIQSDRFGSVEVDVRDVINFPRGIIGFADEHEFVLIRTTNAQAVGWMQSVTSPGMALPVVSAHVLAPPYPDVDIESYAEAVGLGTNLEDLAVLVVLNAQPNVPATVNLVAPIIVNATTRVGAQVLLEGTRFSTREMFILPSKPDAAARETGQSAIGAAG